VDVRVLAATHRDLEAGIKSQQFREDLYYRLSVVVIELPPLRDRKEDIPDLVRFFLAKHATELGVPDPSIHSDALEFLSAQNWPGNVRELENIVRKVLLMSQGYTINIDHVRSALARPSPAVEPGGQNLRDFAEQLLSAAQRGEVDNAHARLIQAAEREIFARAIDLAHGNQAKAARWLGLSRLTVREKLHQFGLHPAQDQKP
jgi:DNA-binding NtrC family response regulator